MNWKPPKGQFESTTENYVANMPKNADHQTLARVTVIEIATILHRKILGGTPIADVNCVPRIYIFKDGQYHTNMGIGGPFKLALASELVAQFLDSTKGDAAVLGVCAVTNRQTIGL